MNMLRRVITKEARVNQIVQSSNGRELEGSIRMALNSIQVQISALYAKIAEIQSPADYSPDGELDVAGRPEYVMARLTNRSGAGRNGGDVVVRDPAHDNSFTVATSAGDKTVVGVVARESTESSEDAVADGAEGLICVAGQALALVDADHAAIVAGDGLIAHSTAGRAVKAPSPEHTGIFATALEAKASGVGKITVLVRTAALLPAPAIDALNDFDHSLCMRARCVQNHYDADGSSTGFSGFLTSATAWTSLDMSQLIGHWTYGYSADGTLVSALHSAYGVEGAGIATVASALDYQAGRIDKIISELT